MRRLATTLLSLSLALPAAAADQARTLSLSGALLTTADQMVSVCDANTVIQYNRGATSGTSAGRKLVYTGGAWTTTTFSGPSPSNGYGQATMLGCDATTIVLGGGQNSANGGNWIYTTTVASPGSWTSKIDAAAGASQIKGFFGAVHASPPGASTWLIGFRFQNTSNEDIAEIYSMTLTSFPSPWATYNTGGNNFGLQCSAAWASSTHYGGVCWGSSAAYAVGYNGSGTSYSSGIICGGLSGTITARQSVGMVGMSNAPVVHLAYNGTNSQLCGVIWNGSSAGKFVDQTISSKSIVGGAYFASVPRVWVADGTQYYHASGAASAYFEDDPSATYDLACSSGSLAIVVTGFDVDQDGSSTDNLTGFCTSGDIVYYGEAQPTTAVARPRRSSLSGTLRGSLRGGLGG